MRLSNGISTAVGIGLALCLAALPAPEARAQFGEAAGIGELMQPSFLRRDVLVLSQGLNLDQGQRAIVEALFADYDASFQAGIENMKKWFEELRSQMQVPDSGDKKRIIPLVFQPFKELSNEKKQVDEQFLEKIKLILNEQQMDQWPAVQRRLYRDKKLMRGLLSGESVNLFDTARDMNFDERAAALVQPELDAYDIALDEALHHRDENVRNDMIDSLAEQDPAKQNQMLQKYLKLRVAVRNVNDEYIERIATVLPPELAAQFQDNALRRGYPRVYTEHGVQRLFREAKKIEGLDPGVLASIEQLEQALTTEFKTFNDALRQLVRENEPAEQAARAEDFARRMSGQTAELRPDATRQKFMDRDAMARNYARQLKSLLTAEQFAQLPGASRWTDSPAEGHPANSGRTSVKAHQPDENDDAKVRSKDRTKDFGEEQSNSPD